MARKPLSGESSNVFVFSRIDVVSCYSRWCVPKQPAQSPRRLTVVSNPVVGSGTMLMFSTINVASPPVAASDLMSSVIVESEAVKPMSA